MFRFKPIFKTLVWGGDKIAALKGIETDQKNIGESWEISAVAGNESVVAEGPYEGKTITELAETLKEKLLGEKVYLHTGTEFPLLIKFIDAKSDLSVQVHPNDELAAARHNSKGKTEMWYVLGADPGAHLMSGLSKAITKEEYVKRVENNTITEVLSDHEVAPGDVFFIPAGRIHAIGGGCLVAEIQQTSNITYRIYDYGRLGLDGKPRELHTEQAVDAIDFTTKYSYRTGYTKGKNQENLLVKCPYFTTSLYDLDEEYTKDLHNIDSFVVVMCVEGAARISTLEIKPKETLRAFGITRESKEKVEVIETLDIRQGETILIPATALNLKVEPQDGVKILTSYIK